VAITVAAVTTAKTYTCKVTATNVVGTSLPSAASLAVIVGSPAPPSGVAAKSASTTTTTGSLVVTFTIGSNNGSAITSQTATCTSTNGGVPKTGTHTGATAAPITVAGVTTAKTYTCTVASKNARGAGLASPPSLAVIVGSPAPPTGVSAAHVASGQIKVTFTLGANNGSAIQSQTATCTSSNGGATNFATHTGATAAPITVTALTVGKLYTCKVTAKNARGTGLASAASNAVTA
jgi:titin